MAACNSLTPNSFSPPLTFLPGFSGHCLNSPSDPHSPSFKQLHTLLLPNLHVFCLQHLPIPSASHLFLLTFPLRHSWELKLFTILPSPQLLSSKFSSPLLKSLLIVTIGSKSSKFIGHLCATSLSSSSLLPTPPHCFTAYSHFVHPPTYYGCLSMGHLWDPSVCF